MAILTTEVAPWLERRRQAKRIAEERLLAAEHLESAVDTVVQRSGKDTITDSVALVNSAPQIDLKARDAVAEPAPDQRALQPSKPVIKDESSKGLNALPKQSVVVANIPPAPEKTIEPLKPVANIDVASGQKRWQGTKTNVVHSSKSSSESTMKRRTKAKAKESQSPKSSSDNVRVYDWRLRRNNESWFSTADGKKYVEEEDSGI